MTEIEKIRKDYDRLQNIVDFASELQDAIIRYNGSQRGKITPLFRIDEIVSNIRVIAQVLKDDLGIEE